MGYVFDTGIFIDLFRHYYPDNFPSLWGKFNIAIDDGTIISTREVLKELEMRDDDLSKWAKTHKDIFTEPSTLETSFISDIFQRHPEFQNLVRKKTRLMGNPCADPFVIAKAKIDDCCVVTTEKSTEKTLKIKIPDVCKELKINCTDFEGFMKQAGWAF